jgi:hypothetical protein
MTCARCLGLSMMLFNKHKRLLETYELETKKLDAQQQRLSCKRNALFAKKMKVLSFVNNHLNQLLLETIGIVDLITLCHEYADLAYCALHDCYYPLRFCCLVCSDKTADKDDVTKRNWNWYDLRCTKWVRRKHHVRTSKDLSAWELRILDEREDAILLAHLRSDALKSQHYKIMWINDELAHAAVTSVLHLGISTHPKTDEFLLIIASERDLSNQHFDVLSGHKSTENLHLHGFMRDHFRLHDYIDY